jgi:hypothetical protein
MVPPVWPDVVEDILVKSLLHLVHVSLIIDLIAAHVGSTVLVQVFLAHGVLLLIRSSGPLLVIH